MTELDNVLLWILMSKFDTKIKLALSVSKTLLLICNQISYELVIYNIFKKLDHLLGLWWPIEPRAVTADVYNRIPLALFWTHVAPKAIYPRATPSEWSNVTEMLK